MKTTAQTTQRIPNGFRMILYVAAVAALGFINCCVLRAGDPEKDNDYAKSLEAALAVEPEAEIVLQDWMLTFNDGFLAEVEEEELVVEDWMLDPASFEVPTYLIVEKEEEPSVEDWMLEPSTVAVPDYLIVETEDEPEVEDWMLNPAGHPVFVNLLIANSGR